MMPMPPPLSRELVLVGGGHTHALVLRRWGMAPVAGARLTLIAPDPAAAYSGMMPGHLAGHYTRASLEIDLVRLARFAGARLVRCAASGLDPAAREIHVAGRPPIAYDLASIDIGISATMPSLPGFAENAVPAKPLFGLADAWAAFLADLAVGRRPPEVAIIGAGVAGVEIAFAATHRLAADGHAPKVTIVEAAGALPALNPRARHLLRRRLDAAGITLLEGNGAKRVAADRLHLADGTAISFGLCIGTGGGRVQPWLAESGLPVTGGFLDVDATLRSTGDPRIHAAGDCAHLTHAPRPKAGVFAVRQAPILYHNLRAGLTGGRLRRYRPQGDYLKLITLGTKSAALDRNGVALAAPFLWRIKDRIEARFMDRFQTLPDMTSPAPSGPAVREAVAHQPLCGGCGSKVGGGSLAAALSRLGPGHRDDILSAPGDDAAILAFRATRQVITTDHLRAVVDDPWLMARIAAVHAMGDIWAMGARPQAALSTVILPRMTETMQTAWLREVTDAAAGVFAQAGAQLAGGHTTMGAEMTLGFTITGLCDGPPITLAGARPGDALILTKPIGSGTLLAAEMRMQANGADMAALYDAMCRPQGDAAAILAPAANAMTDVTGFGLAGHCLAMCDASRVGARIALDRVPVYTGAEALSAAGIRSTIHPSNAAQAAGRLHGADRGPKVSLLHDPQTSGGLLAAVPEAQAETVMAALTNTGAEAHKIGTFTDAPPSITLEAL